MWLRRNGWRVAVILVFSAAMVVLAVAPPGIAAATGPTVGATTTTTKPPVGTTTTTTKPPAGTTTTTTKPAVGTTTTTTKPPLPSVSTSVSDGQSVAALLGQAVALDAVGVDTSGAIRNGTK